MKDIVGTHMGRIARTEQNEPWLARRAAKRLRAASRVHPTIGPFDAPVRGSARWRTRLWEHGNALKRGSRYGAR